MERIQYYGTESPPAERLEMFAEAVNKLERRFRQLGNALGRSEPLPAPKRSH